MIREIDRPALRVAVCVAGSLMFGVLLATWQRVLDAVTGRTAYSLAACAGMVVVGLVLGVVLAAWPCRKVRDPGWVMRVAFLLLGCWLVFQLAMASGVIGGWQRILNDLSRTFPQYLVALGKTSAFFFLLPSLFAGAAVRSMLPPDRAPGHTILLFALLAALPATAGYALASGVLIPLAGVEGLTRGASLWFGALATLALLRGVFSVVPFLAVVGVLTFLNPRENVSVLTSGVFGRLAHRDSGFARGTPVFTHHSRHHTVAVYEDPDYRFVFALDGRPVLMGNRFHAARTLTGSLPLLLRPGCKKAAVFGSDAGLYLPFFVRAGVADVAYGGADQAVVKLALAADGYITGSDAGEQGTVSPGAALSPKAAYDVVMLASEPVWMRGTRGGYSRRLFERCRQAVAEDGLVALHLDARALSVKRFATIARQFSQEFPEMQVWCTGVYDWLLVGGKKPIQVQLDGMLRAFEKPAVVRDFARAGILSLPEALACLVCDQTGLTPWLARADTEAAWQTAWRAPRAVFGDGVVSLQPITLEGCRQKKMGWVLPSAMDEDLYMTIRAKTDQYMGARASAVKALAETAKGKGEPGLAAMRAAAKINPRDALLLHVSDALELEGRRRVAIGEFKGALKCYENLLSFAPGVARSHYGMGYCLRAAGENETAYLHFARAVAAAPEQTGYRLELAQVAVTIGEYAEADRQYQEVLKREPKNPEAMFRYAKSLAVKERGDRDMAKALKLAERACVLTAWNNSEYAFGLADLYLDAGRVMEGMGLKRSLKESGKFKAPRDMK